RLKMSSAGDWPTPVGDPPGGTARLFSCCDRSPRIFVMRPQRPTCRLIAEQMNLSSLLCATLLASLALSGQTEAQEWTRFRGPNGSGLSDTKTIPSKWTSADFNWKVELPGAGHSSPVVWGEKVFVT